MNTQPVKVGVGVTTIAGYGATLVGVIGILLVQILKVDEEQATLIATAVFTVISFAVTQVGRYQQAKELAKKVPVRPPVQALMASGSGTRIAGSTTGASDSSAAAEMAREPVERDPKHEERDIHEAI